MDDRLFMALAFQEAAKAVGGSDPNPPVGAVLVKDGKVIGKGFTQPAGFPHAEVMAIRKAYAQGHDVEGATLYVTLEPCAHYGKTPPCTRAILEARLKKVIMASLDQNPKVKGKGIFELKSQGVEVFLWPEEDFFLEKHLTLMPFFFKEKYSKPFFVLKWAQTRDGFLAPNKGKSGIISSPKSLSLLQRLRRLYPILAVGAGTWLWDLPKLSRRSFRDFTFSKKNFHHYSFLGDLLLRYEQVEDTEAYEGFYYRFFLLPKKIPFTLFENHQKENPEDNIFYFANKENFLGKKIPENVVLWDTYEELWAKVKSQALSLGANSIFWEVGPRLAEILLKSTEAQALYIFCAAKSAQEMGWENPRGLKESQKFARGRWDAFTLWGFSHKEYLAYEEEELHYFSKPNFLESPGLCSGEAF